MSDTKTTLKTASVLAFERKLDPSDALFYSGNWGTRHDSKAWHSVGIQRKSVRGTISNRLKTKDTDPAKLDAAIQNPNPQTVDVAALPAGADTLKISFTLRVLAGTGMPSACNSVEYQQKLLQTVNGYVNTHGFSTLAARYAQTLASGRFAWRNRVGAESLEVVIEDLQGGQAQSTWVFDALGYDLRQFVEPTGDLSALAAVIADGLAGKRHVLLRVTAFVRVGEGQEVFPSQEMTLNKEKEKDGTKVSKILYQVQGVAAMHSQKVGNALRTIDDWHPQAEKFGPIAVEPYGSVTTLGTACRQPKEKRDFYTLLDNWVKKGQMPLLPGDQHFVVAVLIRGGVFGEGSQ